MRTAYGFVPEEYLAVETSRVEYLFDKREDELEGIGPYLLGLEKYRTFFQVEVLGYHLEVDDQDRTYQSVPKPKFGSADRVASFLDVFSGFVLELREVAQHENEHLFCFYRFDLHQ